MRKTLIFVIVCIIALSGMAGYIAGTKPFSSTEISGDDQSDAQTDPALAKTLPDYESLLITVDTDPLPLSLQAGVYFEASAAQNAAEKIIGLGYQATVKKFAAADKSTVNVVLLGPFANEANLQLAQYQLVQDAGISTQRVNTPKAPSQPGD